MTQGDTRSTVGLVIFDCDGVLVDSEPISNRIWVECLRELGWVHDDCTSHQMFVGRRMDDCVRILERELGITAPPTLLPRFRERSYEAFRMELQAIPDVKEVLNYLTASELPCCVASSGPHEKIRMNLTITGLIDYFNGNIFSGDDVRFGKPKPDLFLHAAKIMAVQPEHCMVVEDSMPGVEAGLAAGMTVVHYDPTGATASTNSRLRPIRAMSEVLTIL